MSQLRLIVLKVAQRCNLNCSYCYMYNRGDDSWKRRPAIISEAVIEALGRGIAEHCAKYSLPRMVIELHGGEPLLIGKQRMQSILDLLRASAPDVRLEIGVQTNGLLLDAEWLDLFARNRMSIGISLDGPPSVNDKFRVHHDGRGSTEELLSKLAELRSQGPLLDKLLCGALCVVSSTADGAETLRWLCHQRFRTIDFLLPDGNFTNPPHDWHGPEPYLDFLLCAFDAWYGMGAAAPRVSLFEAMIRGYMGIPPACDGLGGDMKGICVVETDGSIGSHDIMRICGERFSNAPLNVFGHALDLHASFYALDEIQILSEKCKSCKHLMRCGGGYVPHRFDGVSFANPSLYCDVLYGLAEQVYQRLLIDVPGELWRERAQQ